MPKFKHASTQICSSNWLSQPFPKFEGDLLNFDELRFSSSFLTAFPFQFSFYFACKIKFFHHLSNSVKITSTRVHTKKLWVKLQSLPTILKCTLDLKSNYIKHFWSQYVKSLKDNTDFKIPGHSLCHVNLETVIGIEIVIYTKIELGQSIDLIDWRLRSQWS